MKYDETEKYWYQKGFDRGRQIAEIAIYRVTHFGMYEFYTGYDVRLAEYYPAIDHLSEIEQHDRQFTPFEFTAKSINENDASDELWDTFDDAILDGFKNYLDMLSIKSVYVRKASDGYVHLCYRMTDGRFMNIIDHNIVSTDFIGASNLYRYDDSTKRFIQQLREELKKYKP